MKLRTAGRLRHGAAGHFAAAVAGSLITLTLAPYGLWPLGLVSCAVLVWLLEDCNGAGAALRGWFYGLGLFGAGASWVYYSIHDYGYAPVPLALFLTAVFVAGLALFSAIPCWLYGARVRALPAGRTLGFAALWLLGEWLRSWLLTGFPWLYIGYGHLDSPLAGWAPVTGVLGPGFIVALSAALIVQLGRRLPRSPLAWTALALWLGGSALSLVDWSRPQGPPLRVSLVQAAIPQQLKWDPAHYRTTLDSYRRLSEPLWERSDIVIWPEAAIPGLRERARPFLDAMAARAAASDTTFITGVPTRDATTDARYNSVLAAGAGDGLYHKRHLVPFGEYVPLERWLRGLIGFFDLPMSNFSAGAPGQAPLRAGNVALAPFICYEIAYPDLVADWLPAADLLLTISNDAWFGTSIGPLQHQQIAQMRALEASRDLIRATGSGLTTLVDHRGRITTAIVQFERTTLTGTVQPRTGATPFALTGSWPVVLLAAGLLAGCAAAAWRRR